MARPLGSKTKDKVDPRILAARRKAFEKRTMRELRFAAGRLPYVIVTPDGKIKEKWV